LFLCLTAFFAAPGIIGSLRGASREAPPFLIEWGFAAGERRKAKGTGKTVEKDH
jgi:hypothetical protein